MSSPSSESASAETIVLIHGMWMTPLSWEHWIDRQAAGGHRVHPGIGAAVLPGRACELQPERRDEDRLALDWTVERAGAAPAAEATSTA